MGKSKKPYDSDFNQKRHLDNFFEIFEPKLDPPPSSSWRLVPPPDENVGVCRKFISMPPASIKPSKMQKGIHGRHTMVEIIWQGVNDQVRLRDL